MQWKQLLKHVTPAVAERAVRAQMDKRKLYRIEQQACNSDHLLPAQAMDLAAILASTEAGQ